MSIRSLKLKLKAYTGGQSAQLRQAIWKTHCMTNEGIRYYMNWLVLMRQRAIMGQDGERSEAEIRLELLSEVRKQQRQNNHSGYLGTDDEICMLLRQLYECIVPSSNGGTGDAQMLARKFLSPLVDPDARGGEGIANSGRKPRWKKLQEAGDPAWEEEYLKDVEKKKGDLTPKIMQQLREFGLKPLFPLFTALKANEIEFRRMSRGKVRTWDRDMFQQAIERLLSWESWNRRVADEKNKLREKLEQFKDAHIDDKSDWYYELRNFESRRAMELAEHANAPKSEYRITKRQVRGWGQVYEAWMKKLRAGELSKEQLWEVIKNLQAKLKGEFGDPAVYEFLAEPDHHFIWKDNPDRLLHFVTYNGIEMRYQSAKDQATFTLPDPVHHPLWTRFDAREGNLHEYSIRSERNPNHKKVKIFVCFSSLIWPASNNRWVEKANVEVELAYSDQFHSLFVLDDEKKGKQKVIGVDLSSRFQIKGELTGGKLQLDRNFLKKRESQLQSGDIGSVYINFGIDIEPIVPIRNGKVLSQLGQALKVRSMDSGVRIIGFKADELEKYMHTTNYPETCGIDSLQEGLRVMTVDMGMRSAAAVSIFEIVKELHDKDKELGSYFPVADTKLFAVHRRSLVLRLPGEDADNKIKKEREDRYRKFIGVRSKVRFLSNILRLSRLSGFEDRINEVTAIKDALNNWDEEVEQFNRACDLLLEHVHDNDEDWKQYVTALHHELEPTVGRIVSKWRRSISVDRKGVYGVSIDNIDYLENTRKVLVSWSKRTREPGVANQIGSDETFGSRSLNHLNNLKQDRLKQMANMLIMTALGYRYDIKRPKGEKWVAQYPACQLILFEDLSRYRFKLDRSRKENSKLMKWSHRSIPLMVKMQGEIFGLMVGDVYSAYSSRFHAKSGAPGIRCHALTKEEVIELQKYAKDQSYKLSRNLENLCNEIRTFLKVGDLVKLLPGDLIPVDGGEIFVSASITDPKSELVSCIHADINAAQNLQKRFWQAGTELFRVSCKAIQIGDEVVFVPKYENKAIEKELGKGVFRKQTIKDNVDVYVWDSSTKLKLGKQKASESSDHDSDIDFQDLVQDTEEAQELKGEFITLFRDPSGHILHKEVWYPQKEYWSRVKSVIKSKLSKKVKNREVMLANL